MLLTAQPLHAFDLDRLAGGSGRRAAGGRGRAHRDPRRPGADARPLDARDLRRRAAGRDRGHLRRRVRRGPARHHAGAARGRDLRRPGHPQHVAGAGAAHRVERPLREGPAPRAAAARDGDRLPAAGGAVRRAAGAGRAGRARARARAAAGAACGTRGVPRDARRRGAARGGRRRSWSAWAARSCVGRRGPRRRAVPVRARARPHPRDRPHRGGRADPRPRRRSPRRCRAWSAGGGCTPAQALERRLARLAADLGLSRGRDLPTGAGGRPRRAAHRPPTTRAAQLVRHGPSDERRDGGDAPLDAPRACCGRRPATRPTSAPTAASSRSAAPTPRCPTARPTERRFLAAVRWGRGRQRRAGATAAAPGRRLRGDRPRGDAGAGRAASRVEARPNAAPYFHPVRQARLARRRGRRRLGRRGPPAGAARRSTWRGPVAAVVLDLEALLAAAPAEPPRLRGPPHRPGLHPRPGVVVPEGVRGRRPGRRRRAPPAGAPLCARSACSTATPASRWRRAT